jgi:hypothetical protein
MGLKLLGPNPAASALVSEAHIGFRHRRMGLDEG